MRCRTHVIVAAFLVVACGHGNAPSPADTAAAIKHADDSIIAARTQLAPALADTARSTLAILLAHPASAVFDSVVVVQPPKEDSTWPTPYVCGRINGKPGLGGQTKPVPFIYRNRATVFVLNSGNATEFAAILAKGCTNPAARVLLK